MDIRTLHALLLSLIFGVGDGCGREINPDAAVSKFCQPLGVQSRSAAEIKHPGRVSLQNLGVNPGDVLVDDREAPAGGIVLLRQMFFEHSPAEIRVIPRNFLPLRPGLGVALPMNEVK